MTPFRYLPKVLRTLLIINTLVFAIAAILGGVLGLQLNLTGEGLKPLQVCIAEIAAFDPNEPFQVWRYVTYMFIHFDFMHFFFNMLMLWMFGAEIAQWMGTKHFAALYFFCGIFAAVFSMVMSIWGLTNSPIIGASGALMGVFVAYYKFFPDRRIMMFFIIPMKIKYAMWLMVAFDLVFANTGDAIAHFAHLGGVVAGFIYMAVYMNVFAKASTILLFRKSSACSPKILKTTGAIWMVRKKRESLLAAMRPAVTVPRRASPMFWRERFVTWTSRRGWTKSSRRSLARESIR